MRKNQRFSTTSYSAKTYTRVQSRHYGVTALKSKRDGEEEEDGFSITTTGMREKGYLDGGNRGEQRNNDATSLMSGFMQLKMRLREIQGKPLTTLLLSTLATIFPANNFLVYS